MRSLFADTRIFVYTLPMFAVLRTNLYILGDFICVSGQIRGGPGRPSTMRFVSQSWKNKQNRRDPHADDAMRPRSRTLATGSSTTVADAFLLQHVDVYGEIKMISYVYVLIFIYEIF